MTRLQIANRGISQNRRFFDIFIYATLLVQIGISIAFWILWEDEMESRGLTPRVPNVLWYIVWIAISLVTMIAARPAEQSAAYNLG
jgi:hypothetical protein